MRLMQQSPACDHISENLFLFFYKIPAKKNTQKLDENNSELSELMKD